MLKRETMGRFRLPLRGRGAAARPPSDDSDTVGDVARGGALFFAAQVVGNVGFFVAVLILARSLEPGERGTVAFMFVASFIAARITRLGVNEATTIFAAQQPERRPALMANLLAWSTGGAAISATIVAAVFASLGSKRPAGLEFDEAWLIGLGILSVSFFEAGNGFLTGCGRIRTRAKVLFWAPWLYATMLGVASVTVGLTVPRAALIWCAAHIVWGVSVWVPSLRTIDLVAPSRQLFAESIRFGARAYVGSLSDFLNFRTDQLLMGFLATEAALGVYAVAVNVSEVLLYLPDAVGVALLPFIARAGGTRVPETLLTFRRLVVVTFVTLLIAAVVAPPLIPFVFGGQYDRSVAPFLLLLPGALGFAALRVFAYGMMGSHAPGRSSIAPLVSFVVGVGLDFVLIPAWGANGAAAAASAAFLAGGVVAIVMYRSLHVFALPELVPRRSDLSVSGVTRLVAAAGLRVFHPARALVIRGRSFAWAARGRARRDDGIRFLFYHRVTEDRDELAVHPERFRRQMEFLAAEGYRVIDVVEAAALLQRGEIPPKTIALSFDDGFRDVAEHAMPVLRELGFRATVFVATDVVSRRAVFDWYREQPQVLGWDEIVELDREGTLRFEAHTLTHPHLPKVGDAQAAREIAESRAVLAGRLGRPVTAFCYPAGLFGERERSLVIDSGYSCAVSCEPGCNTEASDRFSLRRIQIDPRDRMVDFRAKAFGGHDTPPRARAMYRRLRYGVRPFVVPEST